MNKITIEMEPEQIDEIVISELSWTYKSLAKDLVTHSTTTDKWVAVLSTNKRKDIRAIKALLKHIKEVLKYYGKDIEE